VNTLQELSSLKVGFVSLSEALDLTTPSGRALAGMLAVFAEFGRRHAKRKQDVLPRMVVLREGPFLDTAIHSATL
jgi:hypothetical protein